MDSLNDTLFGPLSRQYCIYFYYLSVIGFILLAFVLLSTIYIAIATKRSFSFIYQMFMIALGYAIFYFQNRLLYSMCINSL